MLTMWLSAGTLVVPEAHGTSFVASVIIASDRTHGNALDTGVDLRVRDAAGGDAGGYSLQLWRVLWRAA